MNMNMNDHNPQTFSLKLAGRNYTIRSTDSAEHVHRLAVYTDRRLSETLKSSFVGRDDAAVITALSLADELLSAQDEITRLRRQLYLIQKKNAPSETETKSPAAEPNA